MLIQKKKVEKKVKKNLDGGLKKIIILILFITVSSKYTNCSEILDYETEEFIHNIIEDIKKVNGVSKSIKFIINNENEINAFVDINNIIHINSGLIQNSKDYVALLSVLAHEIGHIELNHISLRNKKINKATKYNNLSLLSVIAGSAITRDPKFLQANIISNAALANKYIIFSKEQEMEADLYALKTLNLLNTNSDSIIELLELIEQKQLEKGFSKENQRISTHPNFEDRILLIKNFKNDQEIKNNFDKNYNHRFNFIKAKFVGYNDNNNEILNKLKQPYKTYAESIKSARNGNLKMSLENLNEIIRKSKNSFILETKADILFSYGFTNEAIKFYKKNLEEYPQNYYAQIRIFENKDIENLSKKEISIIFDRNKQLLYKYFNNKNVLFKYIELASKLNKTEWLDFFYLILSISEIDNEIFKNRLDDFKKTNDKDILKLINIIQEEAL